MAQIANELQSLPLEQIIGGPMQGAIKASSMSAQTTLDFVQKVGFKTENGKTSVNIVELSQSKNNSQSNLTVPILSMVPVPYMRIKQMNIDFDFKIKTTDVKKETKDMGASLAAKAGFGPVSVDVKGTYRSAKEATTQTDESANLKVHIEAVQDEMPGGLKKLLTILTDSIEDTTPDDLPKVKA